MMELDDLDFCQEGFAFDWSLAEHPDSIESRLKESGAWSEARRHLSRWRNFCSNKAKQEEVAFSIDRQTYAAAKGYEAILRAYPPTSDCLPCESLKGFLFPPADMSEADARFDEIGETDDLAVETVWVAHHLDNQNALPTDAPSRNAWTLLMQAREDRKWFYQNLYKPAMQYMNSRKLKQDTDSAMGQNAEERKAVSEITSMIKVLVEQSATAELD